MQLLTNEIRKTLPPIYAQDGDPKAMVYVKFFDPVGSATWYASEFDGEDKFFGFVDLGLGPGQELQSLERPFGLGIERDILFEPTLMTEVMAQHTQ